MGKEEAAKKYAQAHVGFDDHDTPYPVIREAAFLAGCAFGEKRERERCVEIIERIFHGAFTRLLCQLAIYHVEHPEGEARSRCSHKNVMTYDTNPPFKYCMDCGSRLNPSEET